MLLWSEMYAALNPASVCQARFRAAVNHLRPSHEWFVWLWKSTMTSAGSCARRAAMGRGTSAPTA